MFSEEHIRILHVIDKLSMDGVNPSSCTTLLRYWSGFLKAKGFYSSVCTLRGVDPASHVLEKEGIKVHHLGFGKFSWRNICGITEVMNREKPDVLHLHGYSAANFGRIAAKRRGIPNIVHEHADLKILPHQYLADFILRNMTDAGIAVSGNVKTFMIRGRSIPPSKIEIIGNGINLADFQNRDHDVVKSKRAELGISEGVPIIGTVTRFRLEKGNEYFIRAIPVIIKEFPNAMFVMAGDGPLRSQMEQLVKELQVDSFVKFLGFRKDIPDIMSLFTVNVIPSLSEGFPLSLVEAMAAGNAIVASRVGGLAEIGKDRESLCFVKPKNSEEIGSKICELLRNPVLAMELSASAKRASLSFSVEASVGRLAELYRRLVKEKGHPRLVHD